MLRERGMLDRTALGRVGRNNDCTGLAVYLASDESAFTSGQRVFIDGGRF
jgi:NAD(P)-dependent dehydrogenase (short-subunit alcohol dehydrogenase family)